MGAKGVDVPQLRLETWIDAPARACFELSLDVGAHTASMGDSGERAVGGVLEGVMGLDDEVTWRARHFGVPFTMTSRITALQAPRRFVDEQVRGPFRRWWHEHLFEEVGRRTRMLDRIDFSSPAGPVGRVVDRLVLERYMTRLIGQRNVWLKAELER